MRPSKGSAPLLFLIFLVTCGQGWAEGRENKLFQVRGEKVEGEYIVVFHDGVAASWAASEVATAQRARVARVWTRVLNGALLTDLSAGRAHALARDPKVRWVEENGVVTVFADQGDPPSWGIDRIDQRALPLDANYHSDFSGLGVTLYVIDTGIRITHQDFGGRASWGVNFADTLDDDCHGHGTHVAAIAAGDAHGVAKEANLVAVKVLGCAGSGSFAGIISGMEWVTAHATPPAVANMSLGGPASTTVDAALDNSVRSGIFYAVAAGNDNGSACAKSPARAAEAFTVGATTSADERSSFSNFGSCVDIFAPGSGITSAWNESDTATAILNGTSMASPHVAGAAALVREQFPGFSVGQVKAELWSRATPGVVQDPESTPNLLLHSLDSIGNYTLSTTLIGSGLGSVTMSPPGLRCDAACREFYPPGATVELTAAAVAGSTFAGWGGGGCSGTGASCAVTIGAATSVNAAFEPLLPLRSLAVTLDGEGSGTVRSDLRGIDCGTDCTEVYGDGTVVTLTATPGPRSSFGGWSAPDCSGFDPCTVTMDESRSVSAVFDASSPSSTLTITVDGTGSGKVTSIPAGIDCGTDCSESYARFTLVTLTAAPDAGSSFTGWVGAGCSGTEPCTVTMDDARSLTAYFDPSGTPRVTVALAGTGGGIVTSSPAGIACGVRVEQYACSKDFPAGTVVTLTAATDYGSGFAGWSGPDCEGTDPCSLTVADVHLVTATFDAPDVGVLTVALTGTGSGKISSSPEGIECAPDCDAAFTNGTEVTLSAAADSGSRFTGWSGGPCSGTGACSVTIDGSAAVTATFEEVFYDLEVSLGGTRTGTVISLPPGIDCGIDCGEPYLEDTLVTLTAIPRPRSHFVGWSGPPCSQPETCLVTMVASRSLQADFESCFEAFDRGSSAWSPAAGPSNGEVTAPWELTSGDSHSSPSSFFAADEPRVKDQTLVLTQPIEVPQGESQLRFWHRFDTEADADGGVLEYSTDGGASWFDLESGDGAGVPANAGRFVINGYNSLLLDCCSNPLPFRSAWSGNSSGWQQVIVDLGDFAGRTLLLRWRLVADDTAAGEGWWLDDVELLRVGECALTRIFSDGFESGDVSGWEIMPGSLFTRSSTSSSDRSAKPAAPAETTPGAPPPGAPATRRDGWPGPTG